MKASDYIAFFLEKNKVNIVFGYQGGMITHVIDSIGNNKNLRYIQCYHEQTAAIAAEGYSRGTGNIGCAVSSSGPGVTNMMTGIADAYFDSVAVLYITGQVNTYEYKYDKPIRQQGFQEMEVVELVRPITKYAKMVDRVEDLPFELEKALYIAKSERKGPVLLDIPLNIQRLDIDLALCRHFIPDQLEEENIVQWSEVFNLVKQAHRPMLLVGAGCKGNDEKNAIECLLKKYPIPVITSLMGKSAIDERYEGFLGMVGSYGNRCANIAVSQVDLLIVLGSRLDTRQTGARIDSFIPHAQIIHVNNDLNELHSNRIKNRKEVNSDVCTFICELLKYSDVLCVENHWIDYVNYIKTKYNQREEIERFVSNKSPYRMMQFLNGIIKEGDIVTVDIGQNQMWASQTLIMREGMIFMTSGGLAPMGFSMPAAIGAAFANPDKKVYAICGDGSFHMSSQALGVIAQYKLNITIVLMNNDCLGMINQFQRLYFDSRFYGTHPTGGYKTPSFRKIAEAYAIKFYSIEEKDLPLEDWVFDEYPLMIEYKINGFTEVCPKLEYNRPIYQPLPLLDVEEEKKIIKHS